MRFRIERRSLVVETESDLDVAFVEDTLGLREDGASVALVRVDNFHGVLPRLETRASFEIKLPTATAKVSKYERGPSDGALAALSKIANEKTPLRGEGSCSDCGHANQAHGYASGCLSRVSSTVESGVVVEGYCKCSRVRAMEEPSPGAAPDDVEPF